MTILELAQKVARSSSSKTLSNMSVEDRMIIIDCINTAIFNWFAAAPETLKTTTVSHLIKAPESLTGLTVTANSTAVTGAVLADSYLGATILLAGDVSMNEIVATNPIALLNPYRGASSVVETATIYFDTILVKNPLVSRLVSNPRIIDYGIELIRDESMRFIGAERRQSWFGATPASWWTFISGGGMRQFGQPMRYVIANTALSLGSQARIMIRVDPIPDVAMTMNFDAVFEANTHDLSDLDGNVDIEVPDPYVLPHILPFALAELAISPIWGLGDQAARAAMERGGAPVISSIRSTIQPNRGLARNYVGTRPGF